jgi:DNA-directed RNA polymerase beta subunit
MDHPEYGHHCPINTSEGLNAGPIASLNNIGKIYMERSLGS